MEYFLILDLNRRRAIRLNLLKSVILILANYFGHLMVGLVVIVDVVVKIESFAEAFIPPTLPNLNTEFRLKDLCFLPFMFIGFGFVYNSDLKVIGQIAASKNDTLNVRNN